MNLLITGGCGFIGSSIALNLKNTIFKKDKVIVFDNLRRRGSELNVQKLKCNSIDFIHGDVRNIEDLESIGKIDLIIDCSAEPSVLAGTNGSSKYVINTNLFGTVNILEIAKKWNSKLIFISTSRVYSIDALNRRGNMAVNELFSTVGHKTMYGASKLCSEIMIQEYDINYIINRCGVVGGPGQYGKVDQGIVGFWVARHYFKKPLSYIGFGGEGKQIRDILHVNDLIDVLKIQIESFNEYSGETFNIGGGLKNSISLCELTRFCQDITGNIVSIGNIDKNRPGDIFSYITNNKKVSDWGSISWEPRCDIKSIIEDTFNWIRSNKNILRDILE